MTLAATSLRHEKLCARTARQWRYPACGAKTTSGRRSAIDQRTTRHAGYQLSQRNRKRVEEIFGWLKTVGLMRKTRHRGLEDVGCSLVRYCRLQPGAHQESDAGHLSHGAKIRLGVQSNENSVTTGH